MPPSIMELYATMDYGPAPEDATEAIRWLDGHNRRLSSYIGGSWLAPDPSAAGNTTFQTRNPATDDLLATVAQAGIAEVEAAVRAAREALPAWQALSGHQRARYLYALARQVQKTRPQARPP